jgi:hypothetical protein
LDFSLFNRNTRICGEVSPEFSARLRLFFCDSIQESPRGRAEKEKSSAQRLSILPAFGILKAKENAWKMQGEGAFGPPEQTIKQTNPAKRSGKPIKQKTRQQQWQNGR